MILAQSFGTIEHGKLLLSQDKWFRRCIAEAKDCSVVLICERLSDGITNQQRRYFYGVVVDVLHSFFTSTGEEYSKQDIVDFLKDRFLFREKMCPIGRSYLKVPISLGKNERGMTMEEFQEKKEAIQRWGAEKLGLDIPDPDPNYRMYKKPK